MDAIIYIVSPSIRLVSWWEGEQGRVQDSPQGLGGGGRFPSFSHSAVYSFHIV